MLNLKQKQTFRQSTFKKDFPEKPTADIVQLYITLTGNSNYKVTGKATMVKCCFHQEDTPSLALYPSTSSYFCFGCQKHGDIYSMVEEVLGCNFKEALQFIRDNGR